MREFEAFQLPGDLTSPEWRLVEACRKGELADFSAAANESERLIRAEVIVALMRGYATRQSALGLRARGAVIVGKLDLTGLGSAEAPAPPLVLDACTAQDEVGICLVLNGATLAELDLRRSHLARLDALDVTLCRRLFLSRCRTEVGARLCFDHAHIGSSVFLNRMCIKGELRFLGAEILGRFNARGGAITTQVDGVALYCDGIQVGEGVFLRGMSITGEVRFLGAEIRGQFAARETTIQADTDALSCDRIQVSGDILFQQLVVTGQIRLPGAKIGGGFTVRTKTKIVRRNKFALNCDGVQIRGDVFLDGIEILGETRFLGSEISGQFSVGSIFTRSNGPALNCDGIQVKGDVFLDGATVSGETRFVGAEIGGQFNADDRTKLRHRRDAALLCEAATIKGGVFLRGAELRGGANFVEAEIGRLFDLHGSTLLVAVGEAKPVALDARGLKVSGDLQLRGVSCDGAVRLDRVQIDGALVLNGATLCPSERTSDQNALMLKQARIGTRIEVTALSVSSRGIIDLRGAETGLLDDEGGSGWGRPCHWSQPPSEAGRLCGIMLRLEGFTYARLPDFEDRIREARPSAASLGQWLSRVPGNISARRKAWSKAMRERIEGCKHAAGRLCWWLGLCPPPTPRESTSARAQRYAFLMRQFPGTRPSQEDFAPQPFEQVVRVLRAAGHPQEADWFARKKREFRQHCGVDRLFARLWSRFVGLFFGHYYSPKRAFLTLISAIMLGAFLLFSANDSGAYVRKRSETNLSINLTLHRSSLRATTSGRPREACWDATTFQGTTLLGWPAQSLATTAEALVTAFDLLLPVVDLKQDQRCEVDTDQHRLWATWLGLYSGLGLIILPMFIATAAGIVRREQI